MADCRKLNKVQKAEYDKLSSTKQLLYLFKSRTLVQQLCRNCAWTLCEEHYKEHYTFLEEEKQPKK